MGASRQPLNSSNSVIAAAGLRRYAIRAIGAIQCPALRLDATIHHHREQTDYGQRLAVGLDLLPHAPYLDGG